MESRPPPGDRRGAHHESLGAKRQETPPGASAERRSAAGAEVQNAREGIKHIVQGIGALALALVLALGTGALSSAGGGGGVQIVFVPLVLGGVIAIGLGLYELVQARKDSAATAGHREEGR